MLRVVFFIVIFFQGVRCVFGCLLLQEFKYKVFNMVVFVEGLIGVIIFYIIILVIGLVVGWKKLSSVDFQFFVDRGFGFFVSSFIFFGKIVIEDDEYVVDMFVMF